MPGRRQLHLTKGHSPRSIPGGWSTQHFLGLPGPGQAAHPWCTQGALSSQKPSSEQLAGDLRLVTHQPLGLQDLSGLGEAGGRLRGMQPGVLGQQMGGPGKCHSQHRGVMQMTGSRLAIEPLRSCSVWLDAHLHQTPRGQRRAHTATENGREMDLQGISRAISL